MKTLSELIVELEALKSKYGDLPVMVSVYTGCQNEHFEATARFQDWPIEGRFILIDGQPLRV